MLNEILILVLFLFILNNKNKICEGTMNSNNRELCSNHPGLKSFMFNENCGDSHRHKVIENCLGSGDSISAGMKAVKAAPCKLCNNLTYGQCKPTLKGGYCEKNGEKTDANGNKLPRNKIGRDISNLEDDEIMNLDRRGYEEMKNECNPFTTRRDRDEEDDFYDDEDEDRVDRIDRRSHRRHRRGRHSRNINGKNNIHEEKNESKIKYYVIGIIVVFLVILVGYLFKNGKLNISTIKGLFTKNKDI